ncbi:hypothetical protein MKX03_024337, partial [Papaver bracteatum]
MGLLTQDNKYGERCIGIDGSFRMAKSSCFWVSDEKLDDDRVCDKKEPSMVQEAAPYVIVVQGPPKVGKSLLIKLLLEHYTNEKHVCIQGPITIASANRRRIQFVECPNNMNGMIDAAKYADAVLLLIDSNYGFEMVHIAGVGDYPLADVTISADPCPLPSPGSNELKINIEQNSLDEEPQFEIESFSTGTYQAFGVLDVPSEMVTNGDPCQPILVGGINPTEQSGYLQAKLERHSWHMNSLKSNDLIVVSVGWRRYQTLPIYTRDHGGRRRMLQYTTEDENCVATFWGPLAPSGAGVVVLPSSADNKAAFQILATAVVLDYHAVQIWKKIKRTGTPSLILKETALIKGLFTSGDEVDLFRNFKIKTEDGTRGVVLEAAKPDFSELNSPPGEGIAKCTFDSIIHMGSIIVMSEWIKIEVPRISNQPMAVLEPSNSVWQSMDSIVEMQKKLDGARDCKAHVLVIRENRIAAEDLRKRLTENFYEKLKIDLVHARGTREQQRAVIFSEPMPSGWDSELRRKVLSEIQKKHNKTGLGLITTVGPGLRCDMVL